MQIACPMCGKAAIYSLENAARPFCSERCKILDAANWADDQYAIPVPLKPGDELPSEEELID